MALLAGSLVVVPVPSAGAAADDLFDVPPVSPLGILYLSEIVPADFNGDGAVDLVLRGEEEPLAVTFGAGDGTFGTPRLIGEALEKISVGDFNGDGDADLAVDATIRLGDGNGDFGAPVSIGAVSSRSGVVVGDFNGDGADDVAYGRSDAPTGVSVRLALGDGTFGFDRRYRSDLEVLSLGVGDFNRDGIDDLAVSGVGVAGLEVSALLGSRNGNLVAAAAAPVEGTATALAVGDFDGDGIDDVAVGGSVLLGVGDGTFASPITSGLVVSGLVVVADLDGDGDDDLAPVPEYDDGVSVFPAVGDGTFGRPVDYAVGTLVGGLAAADVDGDGTTDLVAGNGVDGTSACLWVLRGVGDGTFRTAPSYRAGPAPSSVVAADLNGDGAADLLVRNPSGVSALEAAGDGTFRARVAYPLRSASTTEVVGDLNGDGVADLVVRNGSAVSVLPGSPDGTFPAPGLSAGIGSGLATLGDFDGDGDRDVALADGDGISVWLGGGDGRLTGGTPVPVGTTPSLLTSGDFNRDGITDLAVVTPSGVAVLLAVGAGRVGGATILAGTTGWGSTVTGDFNADGLDDLAGWDGTHVSVLLATGNGRFGAPARHSLGEAFDDPAVALVAADLNGDGADDVAAASPDPCNCVSVLLGQRAGTFSAPVRFGVAGASNWNGPASLAAGDFDGNGAPDLAVASEVFSHVSILLNRRQLPTPTARDDRYRTGLDTTLNVGAATGGSPQGVLVNDTDPTGRTLTSLLVTEPAHGTLNLRANGSFTYVPSGGFDGSDTFTYQARAGTALSNVATVTVVVSDDRPGNRPPIALPDSYETTAGQTLSVTATGGVLSNDTDPDGTPLTATLTSAPAHGTVSLAADGSFTYTPAAGWAGPDTFVYEARDDGGGVDEAVVTVTSTAVLGRTLTRGGYWMLSAAGVVYNFGPAEHFGNAPSGAVDLEPTPAGDGYWVLSATGTVSTFGAARHLGGSPLLRPGERAASLSVTPSGNGYWIFTTAGRVFHYGDASWRGDMGGVSLNGPVLDSTTTPTGQGYWMVAADGGIFAFGDARFYGSMGNIRLNRPVMSMAPDPDGTGYWLVASDGGIFAFQATFYGSTGNIRLNQPVSGMVPGTAGYLMVAEDGGIFAFGNVAFHGSLGADPPTSPVVAVALAL